MRAKVRAVGFVPFDTHPHGNTPLENFKTFLQLLFVKLITAREVHFFSLYNLSYLNTWNTATIKQLFLLAA